MEIPNKIRRDWESRFPDFNGEWSHWKIIGDGVQLAIIDGMKLSDALDIVKDNFGKFSSIKTIRVTVDADGNILKEEKHEAEISNLYSDNLLIEQFNDNVA
jgi:hypothetical protein